MSDYNSSLPVRTENNGDVAAKIVDGTITSQALGVDSSGKITTKINDGAGNSLASSATTPIGTEQALIVRPIVSGTQTVSGTVTANQGTANTIANAWSVLPTDGTNSQSYTATGEAKVSVTQPLPTGTNIIGKVSQDTSPWVTSDLADGSVTGGTAGTKSILAGVQYNTSLPTLTTGQQAAAQSDSSARLIIAPLTNSSIVKVQLQDNTGAAITLGQKPMATSVPVTLASDQPAIPVTISAAPIGTSVNNYLTSAAVAAAASVNHDYPVTAGKTLLLTQVEASASGKMKIEVQIESGVATGSFATKFVQFNSTAQTNTTITLTAPISVAAGVRVRVIRTNLDKQSQDLYSTISGEEN